jgi:hypothetical protein
MPLLHYFFIILRRNSLLSVTNIATQENTVVATPQSGCNTSLLQLQVIQFRAQTKLLQFQRKLHKPTTATQGAFVVVATPEKPLQL